MTDPSPTPAEPQPLTTRLLRAGAALYLELPKEVAYDVNLLLGEAAATLSSLLEDQKRMDWLQQQVMVDCAFDEDVSATIDDALKAQAGNFRAAIDAARTPLQPQQKKDEAT